jgi:hypothetical protein
VILYDDGFITLKSKENVRECLNITLKEKSTVFKNANNVDTKLVIYHGEYNKNKVVGWNIYL